MENILNQLESKSQSLPEPINQSSVRQQNSVSLPCAECGTPFVPSVTKTKICPTCLSKKNDISLGITKELQLHWCRYCARFYGPPWTLCERESKELLSICLKKIAGLKKLKLTDACFLYTEEHSRRTRVRLTVQKDISSSVILEQTIDVEFYEVYTQCDDCKKDFTPHKWKACVQVRQKVNNKKTFLYIEQMLLKHSAHKKCIKITAVKDGVDFFFRSKADAHKMMDFLNGVVPHVTKESKELISHDSKNNTYNNKYTFYFEIPKICKDDIIILPKKLCKEFGGVNALAVCYKVSSKIHLYDPVSLKKFEMNSVQYFNNEADIMIIPFKTNETEFYVTDIYQDADSKNTFNQSFADINIRFAHVTVRHSQTGHEFTSTTHLGHLLKHGDSVLGYDLTSLNNEELSSITHQKYVPDVLIVRKYYGVKQRIWKLKRLNIQEDSELIAKEKKGKNNNSVDLDQDMNAFMEEIEQDKQLRSKINLYKNEKAFEAKKPLPDAEGDHKTDGTNPQTANENDSQNEVIHHEMVKVEELVEDIHEVEEKYHEEDEDELVEDIDKLTVNK